MLFPLKPEQLLRQRVLTVTSARADFSPGNANDFYSEADYWWRNPDDPSGTYISRDGMSNPDCFNRHRKLLMRMSCQVAGLTMAYQKNPDHALLEKIVQILNSWFIDKTSAMNPHLNYAQAIRYNCPGRCFGIIDAIHLAEVALSIHALREDLPAAIYSNCVKWFEKFSSWMLTSSLARQERATVNNHSVCYYMQNATYAVLCGNKVLLDEIRSDFKNILLDQIADDGSCPAELQRTKPYGYSLFVMEAFAGLAALLTTGEKNYFLVPGARGQTVAQAIEFIAPFIADKSLWSLPPDVLYWQYWPSSQASLYLAGHFMHRPEWVELYEKLPAIPAVFEILRNCPIRHPQLWILK